MYDVVPVNQLITDKLCLYKYNQDSTFCQNIASQDANITRDIMTDSSSHMMYLHQIHSIPSIFVAILLGQFDSRPFRQNLTDACFSFRAVAGQVPHRAQNRFVGHRVLRPVRGLHFTVERVLFHYT